MATRKPRRTPKNKPYARQPDTGKILGPLLIGCGESHYGYYKKLISLDPLRFGKLNYRCIARMRATKYSGYGSEFNSIEEVRSVGKLLKERYGETVLSRRRLEQVVRDLLKEVRK